jgi:hypothetical protein
MTQDDILKSGGNLDKDTGKLFDKNGNEITQKDGKLYSGDNSEPMMKDNPKAKEGAVTRGAKSAWEGLRNSGEDLRSFISRKKETLNKATDSGDYDNPDKPNSGEGDPLDDKVKHGNSSNLDTDIIQEDTKKSKTQEALNQRIDDKFKSNMQDFNDGKITSEELTSKQVALGEAKTALNDKGDLKLNQLKSAGVDTKGMGLETRS